jgi:hypothetical protein
MKSMGVVLLVFLLIQPVSARTALEPDSGGNYKLLIAASQWEYKIYDLNDYNRPYSQLLDDSTAVRDMQIDDDEIQIELNSQVSIILISRDITHSISIEEIDFTIISKRPGLGIEFSEAVIGNFTAPDKKMIMEAKPSFDVGFGTDQMKFSFIVGDPITSPELGRAILIITALVSFFSTLLMIPFLKRSVQSNLKNEDLLYPPTKA